MSKIIIHNHLDNDENDQAAMRLVQQVMAMGKISGEQYCYHTVFSTSVGDVEVSCQMNKNGTFTFHVYAGVAQ